MLYYVKAILMAISAVTKLPCIAPAGKPQTRCGPNQRREPRSQRGIVAAMALIMLLVGGSLTRFYYRHDFHFSDASALNLVHHKVFENQVVPLDGYRYIACVFRNVTLKYDGAAPYGLESNLFEGSISFTSRNKSITGAVMLLKGLGITNAPIFDSETGQEIRNVEPPKFLPTPRPADRLKDVSGVGP